jgi:hypothetical protein
LPQKKIIISQACVIEFISLGTPKTKIAIALRHLGFRVVKERKEMARK